MLFFSFKIVSKAIISELYSDIQCSLSFLTCAEDNVKFNMRFLVIITSAVFFVALDQVRSNNETKITNYKTKNSKLMRISLKGYRIRGNRMQITCTNVSEIGSGHQF